MQGGRRAARATTTRSQMSDPEGTSGVCSTASICHAPSAHMHRDVARNVLRLIRGDHLPGLHPRHSTGSEPCRTHEVAALQAPQPWRPRRCTVTGFGGSAARHSARSLGAVFGRARRTRTSQLLSRGDEAGLRLSPRRVDLVEEVAHERLGTLVRLHPRSGRDLHRRTGRRGRTTTHSGWATHSSPTRDGLVVAGRGRVRLAPGEHRPATSHHPPQPTDVPPAPPPPSRLTRPDGIQVVRRPMRPFPAAPRRPRTENASQNHRLRHSSYPQPVRGSGRLHPVHLQAPGLPIGIRLLRGYTGRHLPADILAGLLVAALAIPQSLGYAVVAGVPVQVGLYTLPPALLAYALFGTSRLLFVGPISTVSVLSGSIVRALSGGDAELAMQLTSVLAITAGRRARRRRPAAPRLGGAVPQRADRHRASSPGLVVLIVIGEIPALAGLAAPTGGIFERDRRAGARLRRLPRPHPGRRPHLARGALRRLAPGAAGAVVAHRARRRHRRVAPGSTSPPRVSGSSATCPPASRSRRSRSSTSRSGAASSPVVWPSPRSASPRAWPPCAPSPRAAPSTPRPTTRSSSPTAPPTSRPASSAGWASAGRCRRPPPTRGPAPTRR